MMIGTERRAGAQAAISCFSASSISDISPGSNRNSAAPDDSRNLLHTPEADNRACHRWVVHRPGNGHFSRRGLVAIPDIAKALYQSQIPRQQRLLKVREVCAPVVCGKVRNSLVRHGPASGPTDIGEYTMTPMLFRSAKGRISFSIARHVFRPRARSDIMGFPISVSQNAAGAGHCSDYVFAASLFNCHSAPFTLPRCLRPVRANESGRDRSHRFAVGAGCLRIRAESTES
jgi:hypothetical protein